MRQTRESSSWLTWLIVGFILGLLFATPSCHAQSNVAVGVGSGWSGGNAFVGPSFGAGTRVNRLELNAYGEYDPVNWHEALGLGTAYNVYGETILWTTQTLGLEGEFNHGGYTSPKVNKLSNDYAYGGLVWKHPWFDEPTRFYFQYIRQVIDRYDPKTGVEPDGLQGFAITWDGRVHCFKHGCLHEKMYNWGSWLHTQGNPQCDGTLTKIVTCRRTLSSAGGFEFSLYLSFPRPQQGHENDLW